MITSSQIKEELLPRLTNLSVMNQLVNVIYVDSNPAILEQKQVQKMGNIIKEIKTSVEYKLKKYRVILKSSFGQLIIISDEVDRKETIKKDDTLFDCFSNIINREFIKSMNALSFEKLNWKFFNRNFFSKLFLKRKNSDLIHKLFDVGSEYSWIVVSSKVGDIISKSNFFENNTHNTTSLMKNIGILKIDNISLNVYICSNIEDNKVYFGKYNSISIVINKNLNIIESESSINNKVNIIVDIEYAFIQNDPIKCLNL